MSCITLINSLFLLQGAMASYAFFYLAGLYPVPATEQYLLSSPFFPEVSFFNPLFNKTTTIKANNFKGNPLNGTGGNVFVEVCRILELKSISLTDL